MLHAEGKNSTDVHMMLHAKELGLPLGSLAAAVVYSSPQLSCNYGHLLSVPCLVVRVRDISVMNDY